MAHILLAEDDPSMRKFLSAALERAGHTITACEDGLSALDMLKQNTNTFDLLLSDIVMPGMDGIELSQRAADIAPKLKVMFITGFTGVAINQKPSHLQNNRVLSKPFHLNDLVTQVGHLLDAV